jgi:hypothetical protein
MGGVRAFDDYPGEGDVVGVVVGVTVGGHHIVPRRCEIDQPRGHLPLATVMRQLESVYRNARHAAPSGKAFKRCTDHIAEAVSREQTAQAAVSDQKGDAAAVGRRAVAVSRPTSLGSANCPADRYGSGGSGNASGSPRRNRRVTSGHALAKLNKRFGVGDKTVIRGPSGNAYSQISPTPAVRTAAPSVAAFQRTWSTGECALNGTAGSLGQHYGITFVGYKCGRHWT